MQCSLVEDVLVLTLYHISPDLLLELGLLCHIDTVLLGLDDREIDFALEEVLAVHEILAVGILVEVDGETLPNILDTLLLLLSGSLQKLEFLLVLPDLLQQLFLSLCVI